MKKIFYVAVLALAFVSCGQTEKKDAATETPNVVISEDGQTVTETGNATDVLPENLEMGTQYAVSEDGQTVTEYCDATEVLPEVLENEAKK